MNHNQGSESLKKQLKKIYLNYDHLSFQQLKNLFINKSLLNLENDYIFNIGKNENEYSGENSSIKINSENHLLKNDELSAINSQLKIPKFSLSSNSNKFKYSPENKHKEIILKNNLPEPINLNLLNQNLDDSNKKYDYLSKSVINLIINNISEKMENQCSKNFINDIDNEYKNFINYNNKSYQISFYEYLCLKNFNCCFFYNSKKKTFKIVLDYLNLTTDSLNFEKTYTNSEILKNIILSNEQIDKIENIPFLKKFEIIKRAKTTNKEIKNSYFEIDSLDSHFFKIIKNDYDLKVAKLYI